MDPMGFPEGGRDPVGRLLARARRHTAPAGRVAKASPPEGISLCMIVRDEERHLSRCLSSVAALVAEMVVVDTGSRDRTGEIAAAFGARLFTIPWEGDFARARNAALAEARFPWILILDADEAIAARDHEGLRGLVRARGGAPAAFSLRTRNYTGRLNVVGWEANRGEYPAEEAGHGWFPSDKVRLFPNHPAIRFVHAVHEVVEPTLAPLGIPILPCAVPVHHYGKLAEEWSGRKTAVYRELEERKLAATGGSPAAVRELAIQAAELGRHAEAAALWGRFLAAVPHAAEAHLNLGSALFNLGRYAEAAAAAGEAARLAPGMKEARFNRAMAVLHLGRPEEAAALLERLLAVLPGYTAARFLCGAALAATGRAAEAERVLAPLRSQPIGAALAVSFHALAERLESSGQGAIALRIARAAVRSGWAAGPLGAPLVDWLAAAEERRPANAPLSLFPSAPPAPSAG